ncbi:hypothetical protein C8R44DRAFT_710993 [Mycena epipterygia]|nr:hypothetical protein C8R44DRAFT_710993 [Mycena epipterygia]
MPLRLWHAPIRCAVILVLTSIAIADCLTKFKNLRDAGGPESGLDNQGNPVSIANATAMSYALCIETCGASFSPRPWSVFSQRFSTWLLPFLALVCQLPFGGNNRLDNIMSMALNVGSPTLGAYSVILTLLNNHWIAHRFSNITYPNGQSAVRILTSLQQIPLRVSTDDAILGSLIVLPQNDDWWSDLIIWVDLNYIHTWSFANFASIGWVIIAFALTVIDTYTDVTNNSSPPLNSNGLAVAFAWLWLLPVVISWLQIGPRCDRSSLHRALRHANQLAFRAMPDGDPVPADLISNERAISVARRHNPAGADEHRTPPVYNYARIFSWTAAVEALYSAFNEASRRADQHKTVDGRLWAPGDREGEVKAENRRGWTEHVSSYISAEHPVVDRNSIIFRIVISSIFALLLSWGTISAAIVIEWFTPRIGLSCRSGSLLLYACVSTLAWIMLVVSSVLTSTNHEASKSRRHSRSVVVAIFLRRSGKLLAASNAVWLVLLCVLQFIGVYDTCWCNSSVLYLGRRAYSIWILTPSDIDAMWYPVAGATVLASGVVVAFVAFANVLLDAQLT